MSQFEGCHINAHIMHSQGTMTFTDDTTYHYPFYNPIFSMSQFDRCPINAHRMHPQGTMTGCYQLQQQQLYLELTDHTID